MQVGLSIISPLALRAGVLELILGQGKKFWDPDQVTLSPPLCTASRDVHRHSMAHAAPKDQAPRVRSHDLVVVAEATALLTSPRASRFVRALSRIHRYRYYPQYSSIRPLNTQYQPPLPFISESTTLLLLCSPKKLSFWIQWIALNPESLYPNWYSIPSSIFFSISTSSYYQDGKKEVRRRTVATCQCGASSKFDRFSTLTR